MDKQIFPLLDKNITCDEVVNQELEWWKNTSKDYKIKLIESGPMLEVIIYPIWDTKSKNRTKKEKMSTAAQEKYNQKTAREKCARLMSTNFVSGKDLWIDLTYKNEPKSFEEAERNVKNYIARVRRFCNRNGLEELKAIYTTEMGEENGRFHHHVVINISDMNAARQLWTTQSEQAKKKKNPYYIMSLIGRVNIKPLEDSDYGILGAGCYIGKPGEKQGKSSLRNKKKFCYTRNLKKPTITEVKTLGGKRLSLKKIKELALNNDFFENYLKDISAKEFHVTKAMGKKSEFCNGFYLYGVLKRISQKRQKERKRKYDSGTKGV